MVIKYIYIVESHALQALIEACKKVLLRTPVTIRSWPHVITCFCRNDELITVSRKIRSQDLSEILFCSTGRWSIVIRKIKMGNAMIECISENASAVLKGIE